MSSFSHVESKRLYSWWWDSHICPKHSKWLQEDLRDMDIRVKSMINLIEEDADSFARKAEMYYKKRPELMKLVEDFYRAYRALAERYNHTTCALRHAHTMAEPLLDESSSSSYDLPSYITLSAGSSLFDHPPYVTTSSGSRPSTPVPEHPIKALSECGSSQKDGLELSSQFHAAKRIATHKEDFHIMTDKLGLKQVSEMFPTSEGSSACLKYGESRVRKGLDFDEPEAKICQFKTNSVCHEIDIGRSKAPQDKVSVHPKAEDHLILLERSEEKTTNSSNVQRLMVGSSSLNSERDDTVLLYHKSLSRICELESEISKLTNLISENATSGNSVESYEEKCLLLKRENETLRCQTDALQQKVTCLHQQLLQKQEILENITKSLQNECYKLEQANISLESFKTWYITSNIDMEFLVLQIEQGYLMFEDIEMEKIILAEVNQRMKEEIGNICMKASEKHDELQKLKISMQHEKIRSEKAEAAIISLTQLHAQSQEELRILSAEKEYRIQMLNQMKLKNKFLQEAIQQIKDEKDNLSGAMAQKQEELETLSISAQDEHKKCLQVEKALDSLTRLYTQSQEDQRMVSLQAKNDVKRINILELEKQSLEDSMRKVQEENFDLNQQLVTMQEELQRLKFLKEIECILSQENKSSVQYLTEFDAASIEEKVTYLLPEVRNSIDSLSDPEQKEHYSENDVILLKEKNADLTAKLNIIQDELRELQISVEDERVHSMKAEAAVKSLEKLYAHSQDDLNFLMLELQSKTCMLEVSESKKLFVQEEFTRVEGEMSNISVQMECLNSMNLSLKEENEKLEYEANQQADENKALQQEICFLRVQFSDLQQKHQGILHQLEVLQLDPCSFQASYKLLRDENIQLKGLCGENRVEKMMLLEKLDNLEMILERNTVLESCLYDANTEIEELKKKIKALEESCCTLHDANSSLISENSDLMVKLYTIHMDMEKVLEKNSSLQNALCDINDELESLKGRLDGFEQSCLSLQSENSKLLNKVSSLIRQVQSSENKLNNLNGDYTELHCNYSALSRENEKLELCIDEEKQSIISLSNLIKKIKQEPFSEWGSIDGCLNYQSSSVTNELLSRCILNVVKELWCTAKDLDDDRNRLSIEEVVYFTLIHQLALDMQDVKLDKSKVGEKLWTREIEVIQLQNELEVLILKNEKLSQYLYDGSLREETLKSELAFLTRLLSDSREALHIFSSKTPHPLEQKITLKKKEESSEEDCHGILQDVIAFDLEHFIVKQLYTERADDLKHLSQKLESLQKISNNVDKVRDFPEEKIMEIVEAYESLKVQSMIEIAAADKEIAAANTYINKFREDLNASEKEKQILNDGLLKCVQVISSLWDSFSSLEDHIWSRILNISQKHEIEANLRESESRHTTDPAVAYSVANEKVKKLLAKVEALKWNLIETERHSIAALETGVTKHDLRCNQTTHETIVTSEDIRRPARDVQENHTILSPKDKVEMKDIQLDHISDYSDYGVFARSCDSGVIETKGSDDQMLELWETVNKSSNKIPRLSLLAKDTEIHTDIEEAEKIESRTAKVAPAELLSFDNLLAVKTQRQYHDVWDKVIEKLSSHGGRLLSLQSSTKEMKKKMHAFEKVQGAKSLEYATIKTEIKLAEEAILQLIDKNKYVKKKAGECSTPATSSNTGEPEDVKNKKKLVLQQTQRGSRKIGRLELKLEEMQYFMVKREEELKKARISDVDGRQRVVLKDLLYGTKESKKKTPHFCSCVETGSH